MPFKVAPQRCLYPHCDAKLRINLDICNREIPICANAGEIIGKSLFCHDLLRIIRSRSAKRSCEKRRRSRFTESPSVRDHDDFWLKIAKKVRKQDECTNFAKIVKLNIFTQVVTGVMASPSRCPMNLARKNPECSRTRGS